MPEIEPDQRVARRNPSGVKRAGPKFTAQEREFVLARVAELYLSGKTLRVIGADVGVGAQTVTEYLRELERRWRVDADIDFGLQRAKELKKLDNLEQTYWQAWERSLADTNKTVLEATPVAGKMAASRQKVTKESTTGNPAFLEGVFKCIDRRIKLLGIDAAERYVLESRGETNDNTLENRLKKYNLESGVAFAIVGVASADSTDNDLRESLDSERSAREASRILDADYVERERSA